MTGCTAPACAALRPPVAPAVVADRQDRTSDGQPRTSRRSRTSAPGPWPTTADPPRFRLTDVPAHPMPAGPGHRFGVSPSPANPWRHLLPAVVPHAVAHPQRLPARPAEDGAGRRAAKRPAGVPPPPLVGLMALTARAIAPRLPRPRRTTPAARRRATRARTAACARRAGTAAA
jgi:hypothetical protein